MVTKITAAIANEKEALKHTLKVTGLRWNDGRTRKEAVGNSNKGTFQEMLVWVRKKETSSSSSENKW